MDELNIKMKQNADGSVTASLNDFTGEGSTPYVALRNLANVIEYMGFDEIFRGREENKVCSGSTGFPGLSGSTVFPGFPGFGKVVLNDHEKEEVYAGHKLQACKMYKERVGCGLKEAKEMIDEYSERFGSRHTS